jgi:hypothetical protein
MSREVEEQSTPSHRVPASEITGATMDDITERAAQHVIRLDHKRLASIR